MMKKLRKILAWIPIWLIALCILSCLEESSSSLSSKEIIANRWKSLKTIDEGGLVGERVDLWRNNRLWYMAESGYLIDGFENRPGEHPWQGEHMGKWLHAATLAYHVTGDKKLKKKLDEMVERLLATQLVDGYLGTYAEEARFMNVMESSDPVLMADDIEEDKKEAAIAAWNAKGGWDTWTLRYNLYGLLTYEKYFPNDRVLDACKKMGDLLIQTYGPGKADLTTYGTRRGISATTLLESIVMLYERSGEKKYLEFAEEIVNMSENNPALRLMGTMLDGGSMVHPGDGKGYQLMANLLGYLRLYRCTGNEKYLQTVLLAREQIKAKHLLVNGGPWTRKMPYNGNNECFAHTEAFHPEKIVVEGCCDATWIQLNIHLFELTGNAEYFNDAEVTLINNVYQHQHAEGIEWCYMTVPNQERPKYEARFHCCASSEPRGMEMYSGHLAGKLDNRLLVNTLSPSTIQLTDQFGGGCLSIDGAFPLDPSAKIKLDMAEEKDFILELRIPAGSAPESVSINGEKIKPLLNERGFIEINKRSWKAGDVIGVVLEYQLKAHLQKGEEGRSWVAFTYGPIALAQKITEMPDREPFINLNASELSDLLKMLRRSSGPETEFSIGGTDITLIPYYQTGSERSGSKIYFGL